MDKLKPKSLHNISLPIPDEFDTVERAISAGDVIDDNERASSENVDN